MRDECYTGPGALSGARAMRATFEWFDIYLGPTQP